MIVYVQTVAMVILVLGMLRLISIIRPASTIIEPSNLDDPQVEETTSNFQTATVSPENDPSRGAVYGENIYFMDGPAGIDRSYFSGSFAHSGIIRPQSDVAAYDYFVKPSVMFSEHEKAEARAALVVLTNAPSAKKVSLASVKRRSNENIYH